MKNWKIAILVIVASTYSCTTPKINVDTLILAEKIYICDSTFQTAEALAVKEGKIVFFGTKKEVLSKYEGTIT